jgi:hypothetical protein
MNIFPLLVCIHELLKFSHKIPAEWRATNGQLMKQNMEGRDEVGVHVSDNESFVPGE